MSNIESDKLKYSTYIHKDVVEAIRNFAHVKRVSAGHVIESAIRKCVPEKYFPDNGF